MSIKILIALSTLASISAPALANSDGGAGRKDLRFEAGKSAFQTLKEGFASADPARIQDFPLLADMYGNSRKMECVAVLAEDRDTRQAAVRFGRIDFITPTEGPLLPGKTVSKISPFEWTCPENQCGDNGAWEKKYGMGKLLISKTSQSGDLQSIEPPTSCPDKPGTFTYRRQGDLLFGHAVYYNWCSDEKPTGEMYGYCYPVNVPESE